MPRKAQKTAKRAQARLHALRGQAAQPSGRTGAAVSSAERSGWRKVKLGEFVSVNPSVQLQCGKEYPFLDMADVAPLSRTANWQKHKVFNGSGARFEKGDTLFARITPCLENGKITQARGLGTPAFGSTEFYVLRGKQGVSDSDFIHYLSRTFRIRKLAEGSMIGASGRQRVERAAFENIEVEIPEEIYTQKRIADILSAFDDKIELNDTISGTLEQMAQAIFKEWFGANVDLHEKENLFNVAEITYGFPFKSELFNESGDGMRVVRIRNLPEGRTSTFTTETVNGKYVIEDGDILIGMDGKYHFQIWTGGRALLNQRVVRFRPKAKNGWFFLYLSLLGPIKRKESEAVGTTVIHLSDKDLKSISIINPGAKLEEFNKHAHPMYKRIVSLKKENQKLAALRDLLLPRLMSGQTTASSHHYDSSHD